MALELKVNGTTHSVEVDPATPLLWVIRDTLGLAALPLVTGLYSLLAVAVLLAFANGIGTGVVMIIGADLARASGRQGQFLGLWRLIGDVGLSGAPMLAGVIVKAAGLAAASLSVAGIGVAGG